ncbi:MAG TPA: hypothetical protein VMM36_17175 [Opitutaceae bacterium]|nr:hypothetical protein [Opitutaceae bacterium]
MKTTRRTLAATCGCNTCQCARRCRCQDLNALIALTLWDISRSLRRGKVRN